MKSTWPFDQPPNCVTVTTTHVMTDGALISEVYHDADDHSWQFHSSDAMTMKDSLLVSLKSIIELDSSLLDIADLPPGWNASRSSSGGPWERTKTPTDKEETSIIDDFGLGEGVTPTSIGGGVLKSILDMFRRRN